MQRNLRTLTKSLNTSRYVFTDVSLIAGSQSPSIDVFHNVIFNHSPNFIECGKNKKEKNLTNNESIYPYALDFLKKNVKLEKYPVSGIYMMDPEEPGEYPMISYRTSISSIYQNKTENISIEDTKKKFETFNDNAHSYKKLYISCLNECPYGGLIDIDMTLHEICRYYHQYNFDEISLCDTCASLSFEELKYLLTSCFIFGIPKSKIALQLSLNEYSMENVWFASNYGIRKWDVIADDYGSKRGILTYNMIQKWI